jgi:putative peptidoglycan lipid II flippase
MVQNVLKAVYREVRGLHEAAYVLALFTVGSQALALVRDRLLAHQFGAGLSLDLYYTAFRIPDLLYVLFASMLSVYVLIPFVAERIHGKNFERAKELLSQVFTLFLLVYIVLAGLIAFFAHDIIAFAFPGFIAHEAELALLMRLLLLQPLFLGMSSLLGVVTQYQHRFVLYGISPLIYNLGIICGLLFIYPVLGLPGLVLGVILGALGHLAIQLPYVFKSELLPRIVPAFNLQEIKQVLLVSVPRTLTLSLHQVILLGMVGFASVMAVGSVSVFQFAFNLQSVPLAVIGVSYSIAAFPLLARLQAEGKTELFGKHVTTAIRHVIFWSLPIIALLVVVRAQFVRVIFGSGAFDWSDTRLTAAVLALFALSLTAQSVNLLLVRALYAKGNTRLPFYVTLFTAFAALMSSLVVYMQLLAHPALQHFVDTLMRVSDVPGTEVLALPIGYSLALIVHIVMLLLLSHRQLTIRLRLVSGHFVKSLVAALVAGAFAYMTLNALATPLETETLLGIFLQGLFACLAGIAGAVLTYYLLKSSELFEVYGAFHKRVFKTEVIAPQDEDHLSV